MRIELYGTRSRKDHRGVDLISDVLPFGGLWYGEPDAITNAIGYAKFRSRSRDAVIRVFDQAGNVIETHEPNGSLKEFEVLLAAVAPPSKNDIKTLKSHGGSIP